MWSGTILTGVALGGMLGALARYALSLLLAPWVKGNWIETNANTLIFPSGNLGANAGSVKMVEVEATGRYRYDLGYELNPSIGYDLTYLNLEQHHRDPTGPRLPHQLTDISVGFGSPVTRIGEKGFLAATGAIGYAGDSAFENGRAWYGKGSVMVGYNLKKSSV